MQASVPQPCYNRLEVARQRTSGDAPGLASQFTGKILGCSYESAWLTIIRLCRIRGRSLHGLLFCIAYSELVHPVQEIMAEHHIALLFTPYTGDYLIACN